MNWFTKSGVSHLDTDKKQALVTEHGGCEHVEADASKLHLVSYENDPWGREGHCLCQQCAEKIAEAEDNEPRHCSDCNETKLAKEGAEWRWYDFYAAQGDKPLWICSSCRTAEKHQNRVARDREDYEAEMGQYD